MVTALFYEEEGPQFEFSGFLDYHVFSDSDLDCFLVTISKSNVVMSMTINPASGC